MRVVSIVGTRPQFIKAAPVCKALDKLEHDSVLVHTGQHYDYGMSEVFFDELNLPKPHVNLGIGSGSHATQTGEMLVSIEQSLLTEKPDWVLVYGDTNSTLAGALAACKLRIPLAHVEAGLRSFNRNMPEEHNRVLTDHCADLLLCPTQTAVDNLVLEGITKGITLVGDTMYDALLDFVELARQNSTILDNLKLNPKEYLLATVHRAYNTDDPKRLSDILSAFVEIGEPIIFPVHPRTQRCIAQLNDTLSSNRLPSSLRLIEPVGYLDMLVLEQNARAILTDSGGIQKEAYLLGVPCVTLRPETEWVETVQAGWNIVADTNITNIVQAVKRDDWPDFYPPQIFGSGDAASLIVSTLESATAVERVML